MDDYVSKPGTLEKLAAALERGLAAGEAKGTLGASVDHSDKAEQAHQREG